MTISWVDASRLARHTKVIAVADVVESVRLMEQDEHEFIRRWHGFVGFVKQHLPLETGRMHKSLGDGLMMEFSEPDGCIRAALAMQAWFHEGNQDLPPDQHVHLRIGAHIAEFVADEHDIYGTDVNLAARIATLAGPGEIVISAALRDRIGRQLATDLEDLGACHLKHLRHPVRAFRVGRPGRAPVLPEAAAMRWLMRPSVAVLPFGGEGADAVIGEAVADEAVAALTGSAELQVVSRLSTAHFRKEHANLDEIAQHLRTHYVLRGQARRDGDWIGLFAELTESGSGHVVWAHSFKGAASELLAHEAGVVRQLVAGVTWGVMAREVERTQGQALPALESHTLLLAAIALMHRLTGDDLERAEEMLEHLVERNRRHPSVHAWLGHLRVLRALQGGPAIRLEETRLARESCQAALAADAQSPLALCMDGQVHLHLLNDPETAGSRFRQVLSAHPGDALALMLQAQLLALGGDGAGAEPLAQRALRLCTLEPIRFLHEHVAATAAFVADAPQRALFHAERCVTAQPLFLPGHCTLAMAQSAAGQVAQARRTFQRLVQARPDFTVKSFLAHSPAQAAVAGRMAEALLIASADPA